MSDASDTIRRRKQRTLYASKVIQETYFQKGYTNRITYEGGVEQGAMTYPTYDSMRDGTTETTTTEVERYRSEVPNREPDPPTYLVATGSGGEAIVYFTEPIYKGIFPITRYVISSSPGNFVINTETSPVLFPNLETGLTYEFTMEAYNAAGPSFRSEPSNPVYIIGTPSAPTGVSGVAGNAQATISFTPPTNDGGAPIMSYTIISDPGNITADAVSSPIVITGLTNGTPYTFRVVAINANGESPPSAASSAVTPVTTPDAPTDVTAIRGNTQVSVEFIPPLNNGGAAITSYTATSSPGSFTATGSSSPLVVTGLTNGTAYTFSVVATNSVGNSAASTPSNSATPATNPGAPTAVSAVGGNGQAVVSFTAPASNGGSAVTSYTVTSSPGGITKTGGSSPITVTGLTNGTAYTFSVIATNGVGNSVSSSASNSVTPIAALVPGAPTNVSAIPGNTQATISFTAPAYDGGSPITGYTITSSPGGFTASGGSSPITITGLTNGTNYTFSIVASNINGSSNPAVSNLITAGAPLAPVLTTTFPTVNDVTLSFTQASNSTSAITNYRYSLNGGPFTSLSPADATSPVLINGLSSNTAYTIALKATNANGDSLASNTISVTTYTTMNIQAFTSVGSTTWTAPAGVTFVQYLVVAGGGGGGACYSDILVIGDLPFVFASPGPTAYWINKNPGTLYGTFWKGNFYANVTKNFQASVFSILSNVPPTITPNGTSYPYNKWYADQLTYGPSYSVPNTTNYFSPYTINTTRCNNISGGGGGGAGGQVRTISGTTTYVVTPGATYTIVVGAGGAGGTASAGVETAGSPGGASSFDSISSAGGSGGNFSRGGISTNGYKNGGTGGQGGGNFFGGKGGDGLSAAPSNYGAFNSGGAGGTGTYLNFDGTGAKFFATGGAGGVPNTINTDIAPVNLGRGGMGTGATLNSFANGNAGGSGIVMLKWYT